VSLYTPESCPFCGAAVEDQGPVCRQCGFEFGTEWQPPEEDEAVFDPALRACPGCGELNPVGRDFCTECGAPVGDQTSAKPFEQVLSMGYVARRLTRDQKPLHPVARMAMILIGAVLLGIACAALAPFGYQLVSSLLRGRRPDWGLFDAWPQILFSATLAYFGLRIMGVRLLPRRTPVVDARDARPPESEPQESPGVHPRVFVLLAMIVGLGLAVLGLVYAIFG
jgi:hypothetical protein